MAKYRCGRCGEPGHNVLTCKNEPQAPLKQEKKDRKLSPEDYAAGVELRHPGLVAKLGVVSDKAIAEEYGLSNTWVGLIRARLGVPKAKKAKTKLTPEQLAMIGTKSDSALTKEWKVSYRQVREARIAMGLPAWRK